jgi:hypothetical protein
MMVSCTVLDCFHGHFHNFTVNFLINPRWQSWSLGLKHFQLTGLVVTDQLCLMDNTNYTNPHLFAWEPIFLSFYFETCSSGLEVGNTARLLLDSMISVTTLKTLRDMNPTININCNSSNICPLYFHLYTPPHAHLQKPLLITHYYPPLATDDPHKSR